MAERHPWTRRREAKPRRLSPTPPWLIPVQPLPTIRLYRRMTKCGAHFNKCPFCHWVESSPTYEPTKTFVDHLYRDHTRVVSVPKLAMRESNPFMETMYTLLPQLQGTSASDWTVNRWSHDARAKMTTADEIVLACLRVSSPPDLSLLVCPFCTQSELLEFEVGMQTMEKHLFNCHLAFETVTALPSFRLSPQFL
jgi:hypothetical protein